MSLRRSLGLFLPVGLLSVTACQAPYVTKAQYDRDVNTNKEYIAQLEKKLLELEGVKRAYDLLKEESGAGKSLSEIEGDLAQQLREALDGMKLTSEDYTIDNFTNAIVISDDVLFESGSYKISGKGTEVLKKIIQIAKPGSRFRIVGHTDRDPVMKASTKQALPVSDTNMELSALRAVAVMFEMKRSGVAESSMIVEGRGNSSPRAANDRNPEHKKKNRRVEIFVLKSE
jgi:flagellar motor protein MotB